MWRAGQRACVWHLNWLPCTPCHTQGEAAAAAADVCAGLSLGEYTALTYAGA